MKINEQQKEKLIELREKIKNMETQQSSNKEIGNYEWIRKELFDILNIQK